MRRYDIVEFGKPLALAELATPEPTGREALLAVDGCGMCHSDLHIQDGYFDLGGGNRLDLAARGAELPITLGHEIVGTVVAVGPEADANLVGAQRLVYPWLGCGDCPRCRTGDSQLCATPRALGVGRPGGYADHVLVPDTDCLVDIDGIDPVFAATLACSGLTVHSALNKAAVRDGEWLALIGAGGLGLNAIRIARARGIVNVVTVDIDAGRRAAALQAGAVAAIDGAAADAARQLRGATDGGPLAVIDFVGAPDTAALGTGVLPRGGRYVVVGLFGGDFTIGLPLLPLRTIAVIGSYTGSFAELVDLVALVKAGGVAPLPLATRPLDDANVALDALRAGEIVGRVVFDPRAGTPTA